MPRQQAVVGVLRLLGELVVWDSVIPITVLIDNSFYGPLEDFAGGCVYQTYLQCVPVRKLYRECSLRKRTYHSGNSLENS